MKRTLLHRGLAVAVTGFFLSLPSAAQACTACMGDANSKLAGAMNAAMFLMIGFVGMMVASFGGFAIYLSRRAASPMPPHAERDHASNDPDDLS